MYLVLIAWFYVVLMIAISEATSPQGTLLGASVTFVLYGIVPMLIVGYIMGAPARRRARKKQQAREMAQAMAESCALTVSPDASGETSGHPVSPERKEP
jgi:ABC-type transport system involved in cytochrome c biogenesis permease subunit